MFLKILTAHWPLIVVVYETCCEQRELKLETRFTSSFSQSLDAAVVAVA